jgi:hypothetical protein
MAPDQACLTGVEPDGPKDTSGVGMWKSKAAQHVGGAKRRYGDWPQARVNAPARPGTKQLPVTTHLRIQIGDKTDTRRVRCRSMMESALSQRAVRMERIGTFRLQFFDYHLNVLDADL